MSCIVQTQLTAVMDQNVQSPGVDAIVAPGSSVDLWLEEREVEALHVALTAGVTEGFEITPVGPLVLVHEILGEEVLGATTGRQSHFRTNGWTNRRTNSRAISRAATAKDSLYFFFFSPLLTARDDRA